MPRVNLLVADELLEELPKALVLLNASEVDRAPNGNHATVVTLDMPYVPEGAITAEPVFQRTPDGIRVQSLGWTYAA